MTSSDTGSRGRGVHRPRVLRILSTVAAAAVSVVLLATPALAGPDGGATTGPGGTLDEWCTAHGGGMSTQSDGTEQCNL